MRRLSNLALCLLITLTAGLAFAQQTVSLSGIIDSDRELAPNTRVAAHIVDRDGVWGDEIATVAPIAGTFSITLPDVEGQQLRAFRSGAILLPGLQNEYRVAPSGVNFLQARVNVYVDNNDNNVFDRVTDNFYVGVSSLEEPVGFFSLIYVDRATTLTAADAELQLAQGWNIFTARFPGNGVAQYDIVASVDDVLLTAVLP